MAGKSGLLITGAVIVGLGVLALAVPMFTTKDTKELAKIGDLKVTAKEENTHVIPTFVGPAALILGVVLMGAALVRR
ncbi:hypothetical protein [Nitrospirillum pindoramense]|uniref:DUF3185 domain-containing protein n=1 Tax=Nitrospirillum amazonense TaxID=28077 RepID=A0A560HAA5_9PROT|nr:hypothetical protein [Nitrospirillum amazonense]TWB43267.1 hypothetical protein FBZ90_10580 [Nitrospirillum amazonense]